MVYKIYFCNNHFLLDSDEDAYDDSEVIFSKINPVSNKKRKVRVISALLAFLI